MSTNLFKSALLVNQGIEQPPSVNPYVNAEKTNKKKRLSITEFVNGILEGNRIILSQAITLIESSNPQHQIIAHEIIEKCLPYSGKSLRIGITGVPGVGKSTFIESFGKYVTSKDHKLAVLAIDPSSERSKGSILGDKTRMEDLSNDPNAYIRPSPSTGSLGGVARKTRETIILCEAANFDTILVETVGVGQSETAVHSMVDFFLLLMLAGAGDELQGIKRGIMEMADAIVITKADGSNKTKADQAKIQYENALHLFPKNESGINPKVTTCSAVEHKSIDKVFSIIDDHINKTKSNGYFLHRRNEQNKYWMMETINESLKNNFYQNPEIHQELEKLTIEVLNNQISSFHAAHKLLDFYFKK